MKRYAFLTDEGTAAPETCLCESHKNIVAHRDYVKIVMCPDDVTDFTFKEVSNNNACRCIVCGK